MKLMKSKILKSNMEKKKNTTLMLNVWKIRKEMICANLGIFIVLKIYRHLFHFFLFLDGFCMYQK